MERKLAYTVGVQDLSRNSNQWKIMEQQLHKRLSKSVFTFVEDKNQDIGRRKEDPAQEKDETDTNAWVFNIQDTTYKSTVSLLALCQHVVDEMGVTSRAAVLKNRQVDGGKNSKAVCSRRRQSNAGGLTCKKVAAPNSFYNG